MKLEDRITNSKIIKNKNKNSSANFIISKYMTYEEQQQLQSNKFLHRFELILSHYFYIIQIDEKSEIYLEI